MLDVIGSILVGMALAVALTALTTTLPLRISGRFVLAGTAGAWIGLAGAVAGMGALSNPPTVLAMFGTPLVIMVGLAFGVPAVRRADGNSVAAADCSQHRSACRRSVCAPRCRRKALGTFSVLCRVGRLRDGCVGTSGCDLGRERDALSRPLDPRLEQFRHAGPDRRGDARHDLQERIAAAAHPCRGRHGGAPNPAMGLHSDRAGALLSRRSRHRLRAAARPELRQSRPTADLERRTWPRALRRHSARQQSARRTSSLQSQGASFDKLRMR